MATFIQIVFQSFPIYIKFNYSNFTNSQHHQLHLNIEFVTTTGDGFGESRIVLSVE